MSRNRGEQLTREEAIEWFKYNPFYHKDHEPFNMAIKALEQEPCEDAISRQAVLDLIIHYNSDGLGSVFNDYTDGLKFANEVNKLPSVTPKQEPRKITLEDVQEYCNSRKLTLISNEYLYELTHVIK